MSAEAKKGCTSWLRMKLQKHVPVFLSILLCLELFGIFQATGVPSGNIYGEELTGLPFSRPSNVDVDSAGRIYASNQTNGVWRSDDRGSTWTKIRTDTAVTIYVDSTNYVYVQANAKIYRSMDQGSSWTQSMDTTFQGSIWFWDEDSRGNIYANNYAMAANDYIYRSTDQGATFSVWYNVTASPNPVRHIHSVDVAPNDYVFVTTGDSDTGQIDDNTIRRWNGTAWEILAQSTAANDKEPRVVSIWFMDNYAYTAWDMASYVYRFPITGMWSQREKIISTSIAGSPEMYDTIVIDGMVFGSTDTGYILASWDGAHLVKLFQMSSGGITRMSSRKSFPLYFADTENYRLYRVNQVTREDLIQQFYRTYNSLRGSVTNNKNYVLEQRIYNGTSYLDFTSVALSNAQMSVMGLSEINWAGRSNAGFEQNNKANWTESLYGGASSITNTPSEVHDGSYAYKVIKHTTDLGSTLLRPSDITVKEGDYAIIAFWYKSNVSFTNGIKIWISNQSGGPLILQTVVSPTTSWQRFEYVKTFNTSQTWTSRFALEFRKPISSNVEMYADSVLYKMPESSCQNIESSSLSLIGFAGEKFDSLFFDSDTYTLNPSITVNDQIISYSGTLTNGTASPATNISGIFTGAVKIEANISGSRQAIIRLTGTRVLFEDSIILKGSKDNVYYGRYYGAFSPTINASDLIVVTNLNANITALLYANNQLNITITSPLGTISTTKVYANDKGLPKNVTGATSWTYDAISKILNITVLHLCSVTIVVNWSLVGDINDDGRVNVSDVSLLGEAFGSTGGPPPSSNWNPNADVNRDNNVNVSDLYTLSKNYGKSS